MVCDLNSSRFYGCIALKSAFRICESIDGRDSSHSCAIVMTAGLRCFPHSLPLQSEAANHAGLHLFTWLSSRLRAYSFQNQHFLWHPDRNLTLYSTARVSWHMKSSRFVIWRVLIWDCVLFCCLTHWRVWWHSPFYAVYSNISIKWLNCCFSPWIMFDLFSVSPHFLSGLCEVPLSAIGCLSSSFILLLCPIWILSAESCNVGNIWTSFQHTWVCCRCHIAENGYG